MGRGRVGIIVVKKIFLADQRYCRDKQEAPIERFTTTTKDFDELVCFKFTTFLRKNALFLEGI